MIRFRRGLLGCFLVAAALTLVLGAGAYAQQVFGSIFGTVTDPTGSAVNNAKVTIQDVGKGTSSEVNTNESGNYTKGQLIPGTYKVTIEAPGFQKVVSNDIIVVVDQSARFDTALQVGQATQEVEVTAAAPLLQTDRADVAQTFSTQQINQLPNIGRNLQSFELLNPGVVKLPWQHASDEDPQGSVQTMVNGQMFDSTGYYLDGTVNQDPILGIIVINPTFDSVQEVKQANQDYDSEFGYMGAGLLTYSTKSGSNAFHGDAFEYLEVNTPGFQDFGRNPFNPAEDTGVPTLHQNQFGGSIGGAVIKDKLFFFGDAQLTRKLLGGSVLTTTPTAQERTGNLDDIPYQIYDPLTGNQATGGGRTLFPGNVIPTSRLSPQALSIMNTFLPLPNVGSAYLNNYSSSGTDTIDGNQWNTRWDYYMNEKNSFFGRYSYAQFTEQAPGAFGETAGGAAFGAANYAGSSTALNQSGSAGWTHTASPTMINEFRFGYVRYHVTDVPNGVGTSPAAAAGIPGLNLDNYYTSGLPAFFINEPGGGTGSSGANTNGNVNFGYALGVNQCNCPLEELESQYQFVDNVTKIKGNHSFKFGADIRYARNLRVPSDSHRAGQLDFDTGYTGLVNAATGSVSQGSGLATFLLGDVTNFQRYVSSTTTAAERQKRLFWYGQDTWRPTSKLTINYGVRWEMVFPETVNAPGNGAELNLATGDIDVFGMGYIGNHGYQSMNWHNFAPRVGIAYQLTPKTVIRMGYGWAYALGTFGSTFGHNVTQNPPVLSNQNLANTAVNGNAYSSVFSLAQGPPALNTSNLVPNSSGVFPLPVGIEAKTRPGIFTMPVVYTYNFTVERQVTNKVAVSAGYVGNQGRHSYLGTSQSFDANTSLYVPGESNLNLSAPFYAKYGWTQAIDNYCNCANSRYDSFQAMFKVNAAAGYTLQGNYTYQLAQGDGYGSDQAYTFLYDRALGYGNADNIPHQQWVFAQNYDIPFGRGRKFGANTNRAVDAALGGWTVSGITTYYSGIPFNPTIGTYPAGYVQPNAGPNDRPDIGSASPYAGAQGNRNQWYVGGLGTSSSSAFYLPTQGTFGNYPINQLYGPHFINQDLSLMKTFTVTERFKFTLRGDATNGFNHTNLGTPNNNITSAVAGQITTTAFGGGYTMRRLQFSGTLNW
ncbi:MAG: TonB-dependent receptor [Bryobacteraceae bacterium]